MQNLLCWTLIFAVLALAFLGCGSGSSVDPGFSSDPMVVSLDVVDSDWTSLPVPVEFRVNSRRFSPYLEPFEVPTDPRQPGYTVSIDVRPTLERYLNGRIRVRPTPGTANLAVVLFRNYERWIPDFTAWSVLGSQFDDLKRVLQRSPNIVTGDSQAVDLHNESVYDAVSGDRAQRAKAALLNIYAKLERTPLSSASHGQTWFDYVDEILVLTPERVVALVNPELADQVRSIYTNHRALEFHQSEWRNHFDNIPPALRQSFDRDVGFSVKSHEAFGSLQLTIFVGEIGRQPAYVLDVDIDENGRIVPHLADVISGEETNPYYVYELLRLDHPALDIGYELEPIEREIGFSRAP